jgi:hypothetical protein
MRYDDRLPSNVHVLRPRKLGLVDRLDRFLEEHALHPKDMPVRCDPTRPKQLSFNALTCAACGQAEYLTREYCRCGHYLRGQLEDEFFEWSARVQTDHDYLAKTTAKKLRPLRYIFLSSLAFWSEGFTIQPFFWMMVGLALAGTVALMEMFLQKPLEASFRFLSTYTFETYIEQRPFNLRVFDN